MDGKKGGGRKGGGEDGGKEKKRKKWRRREGRRRKKRDNVYPRQSRLYHQCARKTSRTQKTRKQYGVFKSLIFPLHLKFKNGMSRDFQQSM